jgi:hypothetical protein
MNPSELKSPVFRDFEVSSIDAPATVEQMKQMMMKETATTLERAGAENIQFSFRQVTPQPPPGLAVNITWQLQATFSWE